MSEIAFVTDTSADLKPDEAAALGVRLVPLTVSFGDESFDAGTELSNEDFYAKLTAPGAPFPRTAAPPPARFEAAFREAFDAGAERVICLTISSKLSATHASAVQAAAALESRDIIVFDSLTTTHALRMIVTAAIEFAAVAESPLIVPAYARDLAEQSDIFFVVDTLEFLQKGGRIGRASALLGTMLSVKPILHVVDGEVMTADRPRTSAKARARLLELATEQPVERATIVHTGYADVEALRDDFLAATGLPDERVDIGLVGPVAGSHVGPGMYGVAFIRSPRPRAT